MRPTLVLAALVTALVACGGSAPPRNHYYELAFPTIAHHPAPGPKLAVEPFEVNGAYDDDRIVYRTSDVELQYYNYHRWGTPPGEMVADFLRRAYRSTGRFSAVTADVSGDTDLVLSGRIGAIEEVDRSAQDWFGHIELQLRVRDARTGTLLWSRELSLEQKMSQRSPAGLARALGQLLGRIAGETAPEIAAAQAAPEGGQSTPGSGSSSSHGSKRSSRPTGQRLR